MVRPQLVFTGIAFAVLALVAYWVLQPDPEDKAQAYFSLSRALPDTVMIAYEDTTVLVPGAQGWRLLFPVADAADGVGVEALLKRLRFFEVDREVPYDASQSLAFGLRPPTCMIVARYKDAPPETLSIGYPNAASPKVYVRKGNQGDVGLVAKHVPETFFMKAAKEWRSPFLVDAHETEITAFGFQVPGEAPVRIELGDEGQWWVRDPYPGPADDTYVKAVLKTFARLEILDFQDVEIPFSENATLGWVQSSRGDSSWVMMGGGFHPDSAYARVNDRAATLIVSPKYKSFFSQKAQAFRETRIFPMSLSALDSLRFGPEGPFLTRLDWTQGEGARNLASVLRAFLDIRAEVFLELTPDRAQAMGEAPGELLLYGASGELLGMRFGPWGVSTVAFWLDRGPGSRPGEIFLISRSAVIPLLDFIHESDS